MEAPTPHTFTAGFMSAADMNVYMRDFAEWLLNPPMLIIRKDKGRHTMWEVDRYDFEFDTVMHDNDGMFDSEFRTRITFNTAGFWLVNWQVNWQGVANNTKAHYADHYDVNGNLQKQIKFFANDFENGTQAPYNESHTNGIIGEFSIGDYLSFYVTTVGPEGINLPFAIADNNRLTNSFGNQLEARWLGNPS